MDDDTSRLDIMALGVFDDVDMGDGDGRGMGGLFAVFAHL